MAKLGGFNDKPKTGYFQDAPNLKQCDTCGADIHKVGTGQARIIVRVNATGELKCAAASQVINWKTEDGKTDWSSVTWKRGDCTFDHWDIKCNACYYDPKRVGEAQRRAVEKAMATHGFDYKTSQRAYRTIHKLVDPANHGHCNATADERKFAAKYVLWHWPQASNEEMPADIKALCESLTHGPA